MENNTSNLCKPQQAELSLLATDVVVGVLDHTGRELIQEKANILAVPNGYLYVRINSFDVDVEVDWSKCLWRLSSDFSLSLANIAGTLEWPPGKLTSLEDLTLNLTAENFVAILPYLPRTHCLSICFQEDLVQMAAIQFVKEYELFGIKELGKVKNQLFVELDPANLDFVPHLFRQKHLHFMSVSPTTFPNNIDVLTPSELKKEIPLLELVAHRTETLDLSKNLSLEECKQLAHAIQDNQAKWLVEPYLNGSNDMLVGAFKQIQLDKDKIHRTVQTGNFNDVIDALQPLLDAYFGTKDNKLLEGATSPKVLIGLVDKNNMLDDDEKFTLLVEGLLALPVDLAELTHTAIGAKYLSLANN